MTQNTTQDVLQGVPPLDEASVERRVLEIIAERTQTPIDRIHRRIHRECRLMPELTDSLGVTEIVMDLEDEFEGAIPDEAAEQIQTVGQLIDHVKTHLASAPSGAAGS